MYEELIQALREHADKMCVTFKGAHACGSNLALEAADAIEELIREVADEHNMRLDAELKNRLIPVTDEPPRKVGDDGYNGYLVYANGHYEVADYTTDKFDNVPYFHVDGEYEPDVTHYMPLPTPPKE